MSERLEPDFCDCLYQITTYYGLLGGSLTLKMKMLLYFSKCLSEITPVTGRLTLIRAQWGEGPLFKKEITTFFFYF